MKNIFKIFALSFTLMQTPTLNAATDSDLSKEGVYYTQYSESLTDATVHISPEEATAALESSDLKNFYSAHKAPIDGFLLNVKGRKMKEIDIFLSLGLLSMFYEDFKPTPTQTVNICKTILSTATVDASGK